MNIDSLSEQRSLEEPFRMKKVSDLQFLFGQWNPLDSIQGIQHIYPSGKSSSNFFNYFSKKKKRKRKLMNIDQRIETLVDINKGRIS